METSSEGRTNAVQLLRRATNARLRKSPPPPERAALRKSRSFNAYPGFIPDPEIQERLRKQSASVAEESTHSPSLLISDSTPHAISSAEPTESTKASPEASSRPRVTFRKSGLPTKKTSAQRRSRAIHAKVVSNNRSSKSYGNSKRDAPQPIITPDPLGFLASQFHHGSDEKLTAIPQHLNPQSPPIKPKDRRQVRRSRSFNELQLGRMDHINGDMVHPNNQRARELGVTPGINLHRSKSYRQIPKHPIEASVSAEVLANIPLEGVPEINASSPMTGLRRWLSVGRRDKMPSPHPTPESPAPKPKMGRMRSLKWVGKKILPESSTASQGEPSKPLSRSNTTHKAPANNGNQHKLSRSQTERRGQGEIMRSFRHLFDIFSSKTKAGAPPEIQVMDPSVRKTVVENPELSLKELEIHNTIISPPLERTFLTASPEQSSIRVPTPNIADTGQEYFSIPPRSSRRPGVSRSSEEQRVSIFDERSFSTPPLQVDYVAPPFPVAAQLHFVPPSPPVTAAHLQHTLVHRGVAKQIIDSVTVNDRTLLLLDHVLIVASASQPDSQLSIKKVIWLDAITEVTTRDKEGSFDEVPAVPEVPRKHQPVIMAVIRRFEIDPVAAINYLVGRGAIRPEPAAIARFLHHTPELDRGMLGRLLSSDRSQDLLTAFLSRFDWAGLRLDHALRMLLRSMRLSVSGEGTELIILNQFAHSWHNANPHPTPTFLPLYNVLPIAMALLELSRLGPSSPPSLENFLECSEPEFASLLKQMYDSVIDYPLVECRGALPVGVGGRQTTRFIVDEASDPIWVRIPGADSGLRIFLHGSGLVCQPSELDFSLSDTQRFTVTGSNVGRCSLMFILMGRSASRYEFIPPKAFIVEQPFMKHTLLLSFTSPPPGDPAFHEDIILPSQAPLPSRRLSAPQPPDQTPPLKKYLLGMSSQEELSKWMSVLEHTIDLYQEEQDEQAARLEEEAQKEVGSDWMQLAEDNCSIRHQAQAQAAIDHFSPLLDQLMSPEDLITLASTQYFP